MRECVDNIKHESTFDHMRYKTYTPLSGWTKKSKFPNIWAQLMMSERSAAW